jgi:DMSO reductase anchor subunit
MNPAPSVIFFTTLSGAGFGLIVFLGLGLPAPLGWAAFAHWFLAYALAVGGLLASVTHLARPARARLALSQWRSSWLSREGLLAIAALLIAAPAAIAEIFLSRQWLAPGTLAAALSLATVFATAMIYTQLRAVPRWNMALTPVLFLAQSLAGGAVLAGQRGPAILLLLLHTLVQSATWARGDRRFAEAGATIGTATGLGPKPKLRLFERSHTARDWVLDEMAFRVARKHAVKLRILGLTLLGPFPALILALAPGLAGTVTAALLHVAGGLACRWLFFAEAEHAVGLYYGKPTPS